MMLAGKKNSAEFWCLFKINFWKIVLRKTFDELKIVYKTLKLTEPEKVWKLLYDTRSKFLHYIIWYCFIYFVILLIITLVEVKKVKINLELEVDIPEDIIKDKNRHDNVKEGIVKSISKGLYEQGIVFKIINTSFEE